MTHFWMSLCDVFDFYNTPDAFIYFGWFKIENVYNTT